MIIFGFSAFLKLISLNPRPQLTALRERLSPSEKGYDFHRSLRLNAKRLMIENVSLEELSETARSIVKPAERKSTLEGLAQLAAWREDNPVEAKGATAVTFVSPKDRFRVRFSPDFLINGPRPTGVHIWNTKRPDLKPREAFAALAIVAPLFREAYGQSADLSVLSLRDAAFYRHSDSPDFSLVGRRIVGSIEDRIEEIRRERGLPEGDQPTAPPPL